MAGGPGTKQKQGGMSGVGGGRINENAPEPPLTKVYDKTELNVKCSGGKCSVKECRGDKCKNSEKK